MGRMQRRKGATFERTIAKILRTHFPGVEFRRALQSDGAYNSDVFCAGGPDLLKSIWWECNHSNAPNPSKKLEQATRDVSKLQVHRAPVVVWRRTGERAVNVTTYLWVVAGLVVCGETKLLAGTLHAEVTLGLGDFLDAVKLADSEGIRSVHHARLTFGGN